MAIGTAICPDEFGRQVWGCRRELARYVGWLTRDFRETDDLVAETMVRAIAKRRLYDPALDLLAWLKGIARNLWASFCRSSRQRHEISQADLIRDAWRADIEPLSPDSPQEWPLLLREVCAAATTLPERQRLALTLAVSLRLSTDQIGRSLGIHKSNAARLLAKARADLREKTGW